MRVAREQGFVCAVRAIAGRWPKCRPVTVYFSPVEGQDFVDVRLADGSLICEGELREEAYSAYKLASLTVEQRLMGIGEQ